MDFQSCPANSEPVKRADNTSHCNPNGPVPLDCPKGAVCKMGFAVGLCCDTEISGQLMPFFGEHTGRFRSSQCQLQA